MISISRLDFWLLDAVALDPCLVKHALNQEIVMMRSMKATRDQVASALYGLVKDDYIEIRDWGSCEVLGGEALGAFGSFQRALEAERLVFSLLPKGGELWEKFARPNWRRCWGLEEDDSGDESQIVSKFTCLNPNRIEAVVVAACFPLFETSIGQLEVVSPWHATYWKSFDRAFQVSVRQPRESTSPAEYTLCQPRVYNRLERCLIWREFGFGRDVGVRRKPSSQRPPRPSDEGE